MSNKVPQIRFNGYSDAWEQRKLSDLMTFSNGINAPKENYGTGTKMISVMDILNPLPIKYDNILNSVAVDKKIEDKNKVEKGDLIFVRSSEIVEEVGWAKAYKEDRYALYSGFAIRGKRISSYNAYFIELTLNYANRKEVERRAGGSTRFNVSQEILNSLTVLTPLISEQNQIDLFFTKIDNTIALHQRKLDLLKEQKKGYLQKMFPKNGAKVPELRFAGFADDWEERKLGEFSDVRDGTHASPKYVSQGHPMVTSKNLTHSGLDMTDVSFLTDEDFNEINKRSKVSIGDILFGMIGTIGNPVIVDRDDFAIKNVALIKEKSSNPIINKWLLQYLKSPSFNRFIQKENAGGTQKFIALGLIRDMNLRVPKKEEQQKIGSFFKHLDDTIALHQHKLDLLKEQKKGFLQKMFV